MPDVAAETCHDQASSNTCCKSCVRKDDIIRLLPIRIYIVNMSDSTVDGKVNVNGLAWYFSGILQNVKIFNVDQEEKINKQ